MEFNLTRTNMFDIDEITDCAVRFYQESDMQGALTADPVKYRNMLANFINNPAVGSFLCRNDKDKIVGYIHIYNQDDYTKELVADLFQFWVDPEARGTGVARALVSALEQQRRGRPRRALARPDRDLHAHANRRRVTRPDGNGCGRHGAGHGRDVADSLPRQRSLRARDAGAVHGDAVVSETVHVRSW